MTLTIEIDSKSGFCNGVVRAINHAETYLKESGKLYSLGAIVHNATELDRLHKEGLDILTRDQFNKLHDMTVLIRAHGEPPETYDVARRNQLKIIDCTCPVVLQLQKKVHDIYCSIKQSGGTVVIFGKKGHAEVNGLVGQTEGNAVVIDSVESASELDFTRPIALFSQTTKDPEEYFLVAQFIKSHGANVQVFDTICKQVAQRHSYLKDFASNHSLVFFVSGRDSSNGKVLFDLCKTVNPRSYFLENSSQIDISLIKDGDTIGICGATSTPKWQLEEIFIYLQRLSDK